MHFALATLVFFVALGFQHVLSGSSQEKIIPGEKLGFLNNLQSTMAEFSRLNFSATYLDTSLALANITKLHTRLFELEHSKFLDKDVQPEVTSALRNISILLYPWLNQTSSQLFETFEKQPIRKSRDSEAGKLAPTRGIVFTTGKSLVHYTYLAIVTLRHIGCRLPITIAYGGDDDLPLEFRERLQHRTKSPHFPPLNFVDIVEKVGGQGSQGHKIINTRGWANKPFAVLFAPYRETIFVDSDSFFMQDPESALLDGDIDYEHEGALFFRDRTVVAVSGPRFLIGGAVWMLKNIAPQPSKYASVLRFMNGDSHHEMDSGVMVHDKGRSHVFLGLLAACSLNTEAIRDKEVYHVVHGDKETFWMGPEMAAPTTGGYIMHPGRTGSIGFRVLTARETDYNIPTNITCGVMAHEGRNGRLLWFNGGLQVRKHIFNPNPNEELRFEEVSYEPTGKKQTELPNDLREKWWWGFTWKDDSRGFMCMKCLSDETVVKLQPEERVLLLGLQKLLAESEHSD